MYFGTQQQFEYIECANCGTLQIKEPPKNLKDFYPEDYCQLTNESLIPHNFISRFLSRHQNSYLIHRKGLLNKMLFKLNSLPKIGSTIKRHASPMTQLSILSNLEVNYDSHILDVGCGRGTLLNFLQLLGFKNLYGIDAFVKNQDNSGITIWQKDILELESTQTFDIIMFHHSFEHMPEPIKVLNKVQDLLVSNGYCIIRLPIRSDFIWNKYGVNWVQIDAPRHLFTFTERSFKMLAEKTGFTVINELYDSESGQFWASEQYKLGISLRAPNSWAINPNGSPFSKEKIQEFEKQAIELNRQKQGDQAGFILKKKSEANQQ